MNDLSGFDAQAQIGFDNSPYLRVVYWPFTKSAGTLGIQSRAIVRNGVAVVALDHETHGVYLVRQERHRPEGSITTLELPGGGIEHGDTPLDAAANELLEEAGVVPVDPGDWVQLYGDEGMCPCDGAVVTQQHAFLLLRGRRVQDPSGDDHTEVLTMPLAEIITRDNRGEFHDPLFPYAVRRACDWLAAHRPDLLT